MKNALKRVPHWKSIASIPSRPQIRVVSSDESRSPAGSPAESTLASAPSEIASPFHRSLVETLPLAMWAKDRNGKFLFANGTLCKYLERPLEQVVGKCEHELFPPALAQMHLRDDQRVMNCGSPFQADEPYEPLGGKRRYIHVIKVPLYDSRGALIGTQGVFSEISDRIAKPSTADATLPTLAEGPGARTELDEFTRIISHEFEQQLRMVLMFCKLLERRYRDKLGEDANQFIAYAMNGATRMNAMLGDLLALSRVTTRAKSFEQIDLKNIVEQAQTRLRARLDETGARLVVETLPPLLGDRAQLVDLFARLLDNALKFRSQSAPIVTISGQTIGRESIISIRDNGIGVPQEHRESIFRIFHRLHGPDAYPGTGAGLAICRKIVERHGGKIWVESPPSGEGSIVNLSFPA